MEKLALYGGTPVRTKEFPSNMVGASMIGDDELKELTDVVREQSPFRFYGIGNPSKVNTFEDLFREIIGCKYALAVSSGTAALMCATAAAGFGPGDEVIIPSFAWHSDYLSVALMGATPVFASIGDELNLDPDDFERKITPKTKGVICVHYQGHPAKIDVIAEIAHRHGLILIEDVAQSLGASYKGIRLGNFGDIAITSFQTHKILTCGEGGVVYCNDEKYYERAIRYHDLGELREYFIDKLEDKNLGDNDRRFCGTQYRMSELSGAFMCAQIRRLDMILARCRHCHDRLRAHLDGNPYFKIRYTEGETGHSFILLMNSKEDADKLNKAMVAEGIPCGPTSACCNLIKDPVVRNKAMQHPDMPPFGPGCDGEKITFDPAAMCPLTDGYKERFVSIGIGPLFTDEDIDDIIKAFDKVLPQIFE